MKTSNGGIDIVIVSHKRPDKVLTLKHCPIGKVCVPESQYDEYKKHNPQAEIIAHPDSVVGIMPKRQWIYNKFKNVFFLDDDVVSVLRVWLPKNHPTYDAVLKPKEVVGWIQDLSAACMEKGIKLWGFNRSSHPVGYSGHKPIIHNNYIPGGAYGIAEDENLFYPNIPDFTGGDYWISALNAYYNRFSFIDARIAFNFAQTEAAAGGMADMRTDEKREQAFHFLRQHFGDAIQYKRESYIKKKLSSRFEKTLKIPY